MTIPIAYDLRVDPISRLSVEVVLRVQTWLEIKYDCCPVQKAKAIWEACCIFYSAFHIFLFGRSEPAQVTGLQATYSFNDAVGNKIHGTFSYSKMVGRSSN